MSISNVINRYTYNYYTIHTLSCNVNGILSRLHSCETVFTKSRFGNCPFNPSKRTSMRWKFELPISRLRAA